MKAVVMAVQNLTVAFGNVLDIILVPALTKLIGTQVSWTSLIQNYNFLMRLHSRVAIIRTLQQYEKDVFSVTYFFVLSRLTFSSSLPD